MPKYIIAKTTKAEYLIEDATDPEDAKKQVAEATAKCIGLQELIDVIDTDHPRPPRPVNTATPPKPAMPIRLPGSRPNRS